MKTATSESNAPLYDGLKVTLEEYLELEHDGFFYEMVDGVLHLSPSGTPDHSRAQGKIILRLGVFLELNQFGEFFPEQDVILPDRGDVVRPDLSFVMNERLHIIGRHIMDAPDLVVEVLSDRNAKKDLGEKADRYLKNGVKEYWLLDPRDKTMRVWNNRGGAWKKREGDFLESELLPGFVVRAAQIFG